MGCNFDEKILHLYVDNEIDADLKARVENHLADCGECRNKVEVLQMIRLRLVQACSDQKAPRHLRQRIKAEIAVPDYPEKTELNLFEKIKLTFADLYPSKTFAASLILAIVLILLLLPAGRGLNGIAGSLVEEHFKPPEDNHDHEFFSGDAGEICEYYRRRFDLEVGVPAFLGNNIKFKCGCLMRVKNKPALHLYYESGQMLYSLFVIDADLIKPDRTRIFIASGREFEFGKRDDLNFIGWENNEMKYVLAGCCPHEALVNLAVAGNISP
jgi:mycothiol system anti-sigma-R factor